MDTKISVIGLGKAGLPLAAVIVDNGFSVVGVDLDGKRCEQINNGVNPLLEEPGLSELIRRNSRGSIPSFSASMSIADSRAKLVCGGPAPRAAPPLALLV